MYLCCIFVQFIEKLQQNIIFTILFYAACFRSVFLESYCELRKFFIDFIISYKNIWRSFKKETLFHLWGSLNVNLSDQNGQYFFSSQIFDISIEYCFKYTTLMFLHNIISLSSIYIRRKYWIRENFWLPIFDWFTCFEMSWTRFYNFWKMCVCLCKTSSLWLM